MRILITGGNGYIGSYIVDILKKLNHTIITAQRKKADRYLDLLKEETIQDICKDIDVVIHTATIDERTIPSQPKEAILANGYATKCLLNDAIKHNVKKVIYLSTIHVYGINEGIITEKTPLHPIGDYGITHAIAEMYCYQASKKGIQIQIARMSNGFGVPLYNNIDKGYLVINDLCKTLKTEGKMIIKSSGRQKRDFLPIQDLAQAITLLAQKNQTNSFEIYNISSEKSISIKDIAKKIAKIYEQKYHKKATLEIQGLTNKKEIIKSVTIKSKNIRKLGWKQTTSYEEEIIRLLE